MNKMRPQLSQEVINAREIVAGYKKLNENTIEKISFYDPVLKIRRYTKIEIDPRSKEFTKLYGKKEKREKPVKPTKLAAPKVIKIKKVATPKPIKKTVRKYTPRPEKKPCSYDPNNLTSKAYAFHLEGLRNDLIADKMGIDLKRVRQLISVRRNQLGVVEDARCKTTYKDVKNLFKEGKTVTEIAYLCNVGVKNVYNLLIRIKKELKCENRPKEIEEVLEVIKDKMKLNQTDYFYNRWITPQKVKYKTNINKLEVVEICENLVKTGVLTLVEHNLKNVGKKYIFNLSV